MMTNTQTNPSRRALPIVAFVIVALVAAIIIWFAPPAPAQQGAPPPEPGEGRTWRYRITPLPDWVLIIHEALTLRPTALEDFVAAGMARADAAIGAASTDAEAAAARLQKSAYYTIGAEFARLRLRPGDSVEDTGARLLQLIETGAHGIFTDAERAALATAAATYCQGVIAQEAAAQAARWNAMATATIDVPSDLGSPVSLD